MFGSEGWAMSTKHLLGPTRWQKITIFAVLFLLCIPALLPVTWMVSTSLKTDKQVFATNGAGQQAFSITQIIPHPVRLENYPDALTAVPFRVYLRNTVFLCAVTIFGAVLSSAVVAFGFGKMD